jgi:hypothetical protein
VISEGSSTAPVSFRFAVLRGRSDKDSVLPGQRIPLVSALIKISKRALIQFERYLLRMAGLEGYFLETLQLFDRSTNRGILLAHIQLGYLGSGPLPGYS